MRIWDLPPKQLCGQHLLAEHRELHGLWNVLTLGKKGYSRHPETLRWVGKLAALYKRHEALAAEMGRRGWDHKTPLDRRKARGKKTQRAYIDKPAQQRRILRKKGCKCRV